MRNSNRSSVRSNAINKASEKARLIVSIVIGYAWIIGGLVLMFR